MLAADGGEQRTQYCHPYRFCSLVFESLRSSRCVPPSSSPPVKALWHVAVALTFGDALRELVQEQSNICDEPDCL